MTISRRILIPLTAAVVLAYFLFFTWKSLFLYFDKDDMYNIYWPWVTPLGQIVKQNLFFWSGAFRPLGAIYYLGVFAAAGFDPLPFHIVALCFCVANIGLCVWFLRLISGSDRVAALGALLFAFQSRMLEVWFRTAVIYDVLCFLFLYLALCLYVSARRAGRPLGAGRIAAIVVCFILALDAKEMAVCLPVFLLGYELLFQRERPLRAMAPIGAMGIMAFAYAFGKLHGPGAMTANPDYGLDLSRVRFLHGLGYYVGNLFLLRFDLSGWAAVSILALLLAVAAAARSRALLFAWIVLFVGMLPVLFVPDRGEFVMYVSWPGWVLYGATVAVAIQDLLTRSAPQYRTALACAVFVVVGWRVGKINLSAQRHESRPWLYHSPAMVHELADRMVAIDPVLPDHAHLLFLDDGFDTDESTPLYIVDLLYGSRNITVDRVKTMQEKPADWSGYRYVLTYSNGTYRQLMRAGR